MKMFLKQVVFLLIIFFVFNTKVQSLEIPDRIASAAKKLSKICIKTSEVPEELVMESGVTGKLSDERPMQCYLHCMLDKVGLIDDENIVHLEYLLDVTEETFHPIIEELVSACGTQSGSDGCETAFRTINCYVKTKPILLTLYAGFQN